MCQRPIRLCSVSCSARSDSSAISSVSAHLASDMLPQYEIALPSNRLQSNRPGAERLLRAEINRDQPRMLSFSCPSDASFTMEGGAASSSTLCFEPARGTDVTCVPIEASTYLHIAPLRPAMLQVRCLREQCRETVAARSPASSFAPLRTCPLGCAPHWLVAFSRSNRVERTYRINACVEET